MADRVLGVVVAGLGGQGVITASDILADVAFRAGHDVKKAEIHGMSQRGGSVASDVRFGAQVLSPMIPLGEADFLVLVDSGQLAANADRLSPTGTLIEPSQIDLTRLKNARAANVALLGRLSRDLPLPVELWLEAIRAGLAERLWEANLAAFALGRETSA